MVVDYPLFLEGRKDMPYRHKAVPADSEPASSSLNGTVSLSGSTISTLDSHAPSYQSLHFFSKKCYTACNMNHVMLSHGD
jgi:hypothetical protein